MRILQSVIVALVALLAPSVWAQCDPATLAPGNWCQIAGSDWRDWVYATINSGGGNSNNPYIQDIDVLYTGGAGSEQMQCTQSVEEMEQVFRSWNGGVWDGKRQELLITGGGHNDGCDNAVYSFNLDRLQWRLASDASVEAVRDTVTDGPDCIYSDGTPASQHTYDLLEYVPQRDAFCTLGMKSCFTGVGSGGGSGNNCENTMSCLDIESRGYGWARGWYQVGEREFGLSQSNTDMVSLDRSSGLIYNAGTNGSSSTYSECLGEDGAQNDVFTWDGYDTVDLNGDNNGVITRATATGVFNPVNKVLHQLGGASYSGGQSALDEWTFWKLDETPPQKANYDEFDSTPLPTGAALGVGATWSPQIQRVVTLLPGQDELYVLDDTDMTTSSCAGGWNSCPGTNWSWVTCSMSGGPTAQLTNGTFGRFQYSHKHDVFILINDYNEDVWIGRLPDGGGCGVTRDANDIRPEMIVADNPVAHTVISLSITYGGDANDDATVGLRYRLASGGAWTDYLDMLRIEQEDAKPALLGFDGFDPQNQFAMVVQGLAEGTKYEIEATISDPDGYNETQVLIVETRSAPPNNPAISNDPCSGGTCDSIGELNAAIAAASPGSVIEIPASTTITGQVDIGGLRGTATNPIIIRGLDGNTSVLDASGALYNLVAGEADIVEYVHVEDLKLIGATDAAIMLEEASASFNAFRRLRIAAASDGIQQRWGLGSRGNWYEGNAIVGDDAHPDDNEAGGEGAVLSGPGHVFRHNLVAGFDDCIGFDKQANSAFGWPGDEPKSRGNVFEFNEIPHCGDDGIEFDFSDGGNIAQYNRFTNTGTCGSWQPSLGGPQIYYRNVCWNNYNSTGFKFATAPGSPMGNPDGGMGAIVWHNTARLPYQNTSNNCNFWSTQIKNNLFVGPTNLPDRFGSTNYNVERLSDMCGDSYGVSGPNECTDSCTESATAVAAVSNNAYNTDTNFIWNGSTYGDLATAIAAGWEIDSEILSPDPSETSDVFAAGAGISQMVTEGCDNVGGCTPHCGSADGKIPCLSDTDCPTTSCNLSTPGWPFHQPIDARILSGIDAVGTALAMDGWNVGAGADIGAIEFGDALPEYGPQTISECSDGLDNDNDGNIDLADTYCGLLGDAFESPRIGDVTWDTSLVEEKLGLQSDNWPMTWADDDLQYTVWGDGDGFVSPGTDCKAYIGYASATDLTPGSPVGATYADISGCTGGQGSCASCASGGGETCNGTDDNFCVQPGGSAPSTKHQGKSYGLIAYDHDSSAGTPDRLISFMEDQASLRDDSFLAYSDDRGETWTNAPNLFFERSNENVLHVPSFLQMGQSYELNTDGYFYIYSVDFSNASDAIIGNYGAGNRLQTMDLARVSVDATSILDETQYEFWAGYVGGVPTWTSNPASRVPVIDLGASEQWFYLVAGFSYVPATNSYVMVSRKNDETHNGSEVTNLMMYEAQHPWGPWARVYLQDDWNPASPATDGWSPRFFFFAPAWFSASDFYMTASGGPNGWDSYSLIKGTFVLGGAPALAACQDGIDNDLDGLIDLADPGCSVSTDNTEYDPAGVQCDNGADDDGDGFTDYCCPGGVTPCTDAESLSVGCDPGCELGVNDTTETRADIECDDTLDNDGDCAADPLNCIDSDDPDCDDPLDDDETGCGDGHCTVGTENNINCPADCPGGDPGSLLDAGAVLEEGATIE